MWARKLVRRHLLILMVLNLVVHIASELSGSPNDHHEGHCPEEAFPCYRDCCPHGEAFCHRGERRCVHCDTRETLCGNHESLPPACRAYCAVSRNNRTDDSDCVPMATFIVCTVVLGTIAVLALLALAAIFICARRSQLNRWPVCLRWVLGLNVLQQVFCKAGSEKPCNITTEEEASMLQHTNQIGPDVTDVVQNGSGRVGTEGGASTHRHAPESQRDPEPAETRAGSTADGGRTPPRDAGPRSDPQLPADPLYKPDFSRMNPTPDSDSAVIATGTDNPAKNYYSPPPMPESRPSFPPSAS